MAATDFGYTANDVAEVLGRLSSVAAGKPFNFPEGSVNLAPQDLQAQWQAAASGGGVVDAATVENLRVVYNYIEALIISCGAPDSFDVYEVCFEALTKIGFCMQGPQPKDLLLRLLEDVHEVYDVLLSCVETYEWVQPGATGKLRLWMLQVIFVGFGSTAITGRDLMELTDNDTSGAVSLIASILRCDQAPFEMQAAAGRCLVELTTADSVFLAGGEQGEDWQSQQIAKLTAMLNRHVNGLIKGIIQFDIVEAFGHCICQHQQSHSRTDIIVKHFLTTFHNCLLYCSENQKKLRQHLATQSTIVQDIMIPYVLNILPALYDSPACGPRMIEWQNLKSVLQTFVVVTFNINVFRPQLRDADMILKVCEVPNVLAHISMMELLIKLSINIDFTKGPYYDTILATLSNAFMQLPPESKSRLQRRLTSEQSMRLPYSTTAVQAREAFAFALTPPAGEETLEPAAVAARKANRKNRWRNAKNKARKRKGLFAMQRTHKRKDAGSAAAAPEDDEEEEDSDEDDMPPLIPAEGWESHLGPTDEAGVPSQAKCQLSGMLMHDPVATPEGYLFERAALEDWTASWGTNPVTGTPLSVAECQDATQIQNMIQGYQLQTLSACHIAPNAFDEPPPPEVEPPVPAKPVPTGPSLLGDLPALEKEKKAKKEKSKIRIESRSVVDCPDDMRCAIDGKVMINPVRSPYGHLFEKKTLERWAANCGSVCPVTQKPMRLEDCVPDAETKKRIIKFLKGQ
mmetsp:Transcript_100192/g.323205  ORF Transcript_100192/g.323205 Transcript_100192/m.323205 type:complete len:742 (+) Transcript_100192:53-2278(+)